VKEPRLCRLLPLWLPLAKELNVRFHALHISRHPDEVAGSLRVRNGMSLEHTRLLWMQHVVEAHAASRDLPRAVLHFDELLSDWSEGLSVVAERFDLDWPKSIQRMAPEIEDFLSPMERHHTLSSPREARLPGLLQHLYAACSSPAKSVQWQLIDHCVERCQEARETMLPGFNLLQSRIDTLEARLGTAESTAHDLAQRNEGVLQALGWVASRLPGGMKTGGAQVDVAKLYYRTNEDNYTEERGAICTWHCNGTKVALAFELDPSIRADFLRFDPVGRAGEFEVGTVRIDGVPLALRESVLNANQYRLPGGGHGVRFGSSDDDPYVELALPAGGGEVRLVEVECRSISAADELAESVEEVLRVHQESLQRVLQDIQDSQATMSGELYSLVKAETERMTDAQLSIQEQVDALDQRYLALLEQMQKGWLWRLRRKS